MTEAGQAEAGQNSDSLVGKPQTVESPETIDAITQIFALFRVNYHNQYYSAFSDIELLNQAKRLWLSSLHHYPAECLLKGAQQIIEQSEYLPTLNKMIEACDQQASETGLPVARDAYLEACLAPHPKAQQPWSHPAVYHAGAQTGWYDLESQAEYISWPNFKRNYEAFKRRVLQGESLTIEKHEALTESTDSSLSKADRQQQLQKLRDNLKL